MTAFAVSTIAQVDLTVRDTARAAEFYRDTLGLPLVFLARTAAFFDCGAVRLMLRRAVREQAPSTSTLHFQVDDIEAAAESLAARGVPFDRHPHLVARMPDHELWLALFRDPDGNRLALIGEKK